MTSPTSLNNIADVEFKTPPGNYSAEVFVTGFAKIARYGQAAFYPRGMHILEVEPPPPSDPDEEFRDEQRSWWQRLLDWLDNFWENLAKFFKDLIIPRDGFFDQYMADWRTWADEHLGFVFEIPDILIALMTRLFNFTLPAVPSLTLPAAVIELPMTTVTLWPDTTMTFFIRSLCGFFARFPEDFHNSMTKGQGGRVPPTGGGYPPPQ